jgi:hypothetical protein
MVTPVESVRRNGMPRDSRGHQDHLVRMETTLAFLEHIADEEEDADFGPRNAAR